MFRDRLIDFVTGFFFLLFNKLLFFYG